MAASNLSISNFVSADSVNPVSQDEQGWRDLAYGEDALLIEIEVICSDMVEHRRRFESRTADIAGFTHLS